MRLQGLWSTGGGIFISESHDVFQAKREVAPKEDTSYSDPVAKASIAASIQNQTLFILTSISILPPTNKRLPLLLKHTLLLSWRLPPRPGLNKHHQRCQPGPGQEQSAQSSLIPFNRHLAVTVGKTPHQSRGTE